MEVPINIYEFQKTLVKEVVLDIPEEPFAFSSGVDMACVSPIWSKEEKPLIVGLNVVWLTHYFLFEITHFSMYFSSINDLLKDGEKTTIGRIDGMRIEVIQYIINKDFSRGYISIERFMGGYQELLNTMNKALGI
jgi:hypothetical protein